MWTTLQDQSFLLGAALVILVHATKFGELNLGNPVANRYIALMPGAKVGPYAYHIALFAFLAVSFGSYYLCCQISPNILKGATKVFGNVDADNAGQPCVSCITSWQRPASLNSWASEWHAGKPSGATP